ncbi:hypothetical protein IWX50DRAFT_460477 [Phyllosticta citricarpa]|uniref:N-acetyltransferase domain-containing protein n=1 Tax=Phyllosticta citricarpa TaxID=55181 RepID=A0ABR1L2D8_9PEZI
MDQLNTQNPGTHEKFLRIQGWANECEEAIAPKRQELEDRRQLRRDSPALINGRSRIPHGNRKRVPVQPGQPLVASHLGQNPNKKPASQQQQSFPPRGRRPRGPGFHRPQAAAHSSHDEHPTAHRNSAHSRHSASRGRRIWKESSEQPDDTNIASVADSDAPQTPNKLNFEDIQNSQPRSSHLSHPSNRVSNVQLLHDSFVGSSAQNKQMHNDSSKTAFESPKMEAPPKPNYVPPHLRNSRHTTGKNNPNSTPSPQPDYVPPHKRTGKGKGRGNRKRNPSQPKAAANSVHHNGQAAHNGTAQPSEANRPNENGVKKGNEQDEVTEVFRRPACAIPKNVWTCKPGKPQPTAAPAKQERGRKAFATDKEIRQTYGTGKSPAGSHWQWENDEGWDKVCGPDKDDPNYDAMRLVDWEGNWLPCVDWTYREAFTVDPVKHKQFIQTWILRGPQPGDESAIEVPGGEHEIATPSWAAIEIDGMVLQDWWKEAFDGHRVERDCVPWWTTFTAGSPNQLVPHNVPDCKVDRKDSEHEDVAFMRDMGSEEASKKFREKERRKAERRRKREQEYEERAALIEHDLWNAPVTPKINTKIDLYVRFAQPADMAKITEIYNAVLETSVRVPERAAVTTAEMTARWTESQKDSFAWLVAIEQPGRSRRDATKEQILGFGAAGDYHCIHGMYRYTAEIEVFVNPKFQRQGIGSCLMDRLMKQSSLEYEGFDGYEFVGDGSNLAERGGGRMLSGVIMNVPHDSDDPKDLDDVTKFLSKFDMNKVGNLPGIGIKLKKNVDLAIFHVKISPTIDPTRELGL